MMVILLFASVFLVLGLWYENRGALISPSEYIFVVLGIIVAIGVAIGIILLG